MVLANLFIWFLAVILSNYYDLPFNDVLDWKKFSVILKESDVYQLKPILKDIPDEKFLALHRNLVKVGEPLLCRLKIFLLLQEFIYDFYFMLFFFFFCPNLIVLFPLEKENVGN